MRKSKGQSLVEYALILALVAIVVIAALRAVGAQAQNNMQAVADNLAT